MRFETALHRGLLISACIGLAACAPKLYQRETLQVDHRDFERFEIRYAPMDGCLLNRDVPVAYRLQRPDYALLIEVGFGNGENTASLALSLTGDNDLSARFNGVAPLPQAHRLDDGVRYRIPVSSMRGGQLAFDVLLDQIMLEREILQVQTQRCRAISLGDRPAGPAP